VADLTFEEIVEAAQKLTDDQKALFVRRLEFTHITREILIAEMDLLRATGAFNHVESLRNKYATEDFDLSEEELDAILHDVSTEWEAELDEFFTDED
jgi:hypothetical protein